MSKEIIKELTDLNAVSGNEENVYEYLENIMKDGSEISSDNMGSFVAKIKGKNPGKNVMVVAHMDEVGFMLRTITNSGFVKIETLGGIVATTPTSNQVTLLTDEGKEFTGVVLTKSPHMSKENEKFSKEDIVIDFGFDSKKEALENGLQVGDRISFKNEFVDLGNKLVAKAFDNRLGCAVIAELYSKFKDLEYGNLFLCASVQEEAGLRGARTIVHSIEDKIDNIIVVDVSPVEDGFNDNYNPDVRLGNGCLLRVKDPSTVFPHAEMKRIKKLAKENDIAYQTYFSRGGTDAAMLQVQDSGYKTVAICVGGRNLHARNSIIDYRDYTSARDLVALYIQDIIKG